MAKYVYAYKGGATPEGMSEEQMKGVMAAWMAWFGSLGDSVVEIGNPFGASKAVGADSTSGLTGFSVISADSLDDAAAKAGGCPIIGEGGSVEVYEAVSM